MYKNRKSSRESIQLDPILGPFQTFPTPLCKQETKVEANWSAKDALLSLCSLLSFLFLKALSPVLILLPPSFICSFQFSFLLLLLLFFNTGAEASARPSLLAWERGMWCSLGTGWPDPGAHSGWQAAGSRPEAGEAPAPCSEGLESTTDISSSHPGRSRLVCYSP